MRRGHLIAAFVLVDLVVVGSVLLALDYQYASFAVFAVAAVFATAWAFYEVGASEDRDREAGRS